MPTTKDSIRGALQQLDHTNPEQWTDDGLPRVSVVSALVADSTLTRAQINEAQPGFGRADPNGSVRASEETIAPALDVYGHDAVADDDFDPTMEPDVDGPGEPLSEAEVRAILTRRVTDAEMKLEQARVATREARDEEVRAAARIDRARGDLNRRFPPLSQEEAIKAHIESQQRQLHERVTGHSGVNQLDQAMQRSNRRGWTRPVRPVITGIAS